MLPEEFVLNSRGRNRGEQRIVQPDAWISTPGTVALVAREYAALTREAGDRVPLLLLILGTPPPVPLPRERLHVGEAIERYLPAVLPGTDPHRWPDRDIWRRIPEIWAWITWSEIRTVVTDQLAAFTNTDPSVHAAVTRAADSIVRAIAWHT